MSFLLSVDRGVILIHEGWEVGSDGSASGGILFASSGKKYAKNAAKTKVLES